MFCCATLLGGLTISSIFLRVIRVGIAGRSRISDFGQAVWRASRTRELIGLARGKWRLVLGRRNRLLP